MTSIHDDADSTRQTTEKFRSIDNVPFPIPRIFDSTDKKLNFVVSTYGEFVDNIYREIDSNSVLGAVMGRSNQQVTNHRKIFTPADIVRDGYLMKRGSWFRNWKRRYFVLRKDIRALCYFESKDYLKLLGTVPLSKVTNIEQVPSNQADGYENVLSIQPWSLRDSRKSEIYIRAGSAEEMSAWEADLITEAISTAEIKSDANGDWWTAVLDKIPEVTSIVTTPRREAISSSMARKFESPKVQKTVKFTNEQPIISQNNTRSTITAEQADANEIFVEIIPKPSSLGMDSDVSGSATIHPSQYDADESTDDEDEEENHERIPISKKKSITLNDTGDHGSTTMALSVDTPLSSSMTSTTTETVHTNLGLLNLQENAESNASSLQAARVLSSSSSSSTTNSTADGSHGLRSIAHRISAAKIAVLRSSSGLEEELSNIRKYFSTHRSTINKVSTAKRDVKMKVEKNSGPPPFQHPRVDRFQNGPTNNLSGVQLSIQLVNICSTHDRLFAVVFSGTSPSGNDRFGETQTSRQLQQQLQWTQTSMSEIYTVIDKPAYGANFIDEVRIHFSLLQEPLPQDTRLVVVAVYRCNSSDVAGTSAKDSSKLRSNSANSTATNPIENKSNYSNNLQQHQPIARVVIPHKKWNQYPIFYAKMKILLEIVADISSPMSGEQKALLGVVKLTSSTLSDCRLKLTESLSCPPYAEMMYSFQTTTGKTLSLEQIYASSYATYVAEAMMKFIQLDRGTGIANLIDIVKSALEEIEDDLKTNPVSSSSTTYRLSITSITNTENFMVSTEGQYIASLLLNQELLLQALNLMVLLQEEFHNDFVMVTENCQYSRSTSRDGELSDYIVIPPDDGGLKLRRSVWKKNPQWQYNTTNLNLHIMTSRHFSFVEMLPSSSSSSLEGDRDDDNTHDRNDARSKSTIERLHSLRAPSTQNEFPSNKKTSSSKQTLYCFPTITLGCPAAHALKYREGGLRRIFGNISGESRLLWLHMIQSDVQWEELFAFMDARPKESTQLFGQSNSLLVNIMGSSTPSLTNAVVNAQEILRKVHTMKRKLELTQRLDICCSQILAYALTQIRTILLLASQVGGDFLEVLQRSLKIGFLLGLESLLSTFGDELGMIEDLEVACDWMKLITLRFVTYETMAHTNAMMPRREIKNNSAGERGSEHRHYGSSSRVVAGSSSGITIRRDIVGRLIVDLEVSEKEVDTIKQALAFMATYVPSPEESSSSLDKLPSQDIHPALVFNPYPVVQYVDIEPTVHAVTSLLGVVFTQGVNEMQTLANVSQSLVMKQTEINNETMKQLSVYFSKYLHALNFQMKQTGNEIASQPTIKKKSISLSRSLSISVRKSLRPLNSTNESILTPAKWSTSVSSSSSSSAAAAAAATTAVHSFPGPNATSSPTSSLSDVDQYLELLISKVIQANRKLYEEAKVAVSKAVSSPTEKHVDVLLKCSALCRRMGGTIGILCKSGKDRTGMGVTLEITRSLIEELGVLGGTEICQLLRTYGVRRMNVYANTGQSKFAFNSVQRQTLPACYRPPVGTHGGNVSS